MRFRKCQATLHFAFSVISRGCTETQLHNAVSGTLTLDNAIFGTIDICQVRVAILACFGHICRVAGVALSVGYCTKHHIRHITLRHYATLYRHTDLFCNRQSFHSASFRFIMQHPLQKRAIVMCLHSTGTIFPPAICSENAILPHMQGIWYDWHDISYNNGHRRNAGGQ